MRYKGYTRLPLVWKLAPWLWRPLMRWQVRQEINDLAEEMNQRFGQASRFHAQGPVIFRQVYNAEMYRLEGQYKAAGKLAAQRDFEARNANA